jgi:hypothetical protein
VNAVYRLSLTLLVAAATLLAPASAWAQNKKPAVIVSIASLDKVLGDIGYLTKAAGTPEFGGFVTLMAGPYLQGLDTKKPAGVYLQIAGPQPTGVAFVPVTNLDMVLQQLENNNVEVEDAGDGLKKINLPQRAIYLKENNGWVFISDSEDNLTDLPADPSQMLGGLNKTYNLAFQLNVRSIPEELVDTAISEIKNGLELDLENETDEEKKRLKETVGRQSLEQFTRLVRESDQITVGWGVDSKAGRTFFDFGMTAVAGSKLAEQMNAYKKMKSNFAGLELADAAATLRFTAPIAKEDIAQATEGLKAVREQALAGIEKDENLSDEDAKKAATQIVTALFDLVTATFEAGKVDGGAAIMLEDTSVKVVAGGFVADGKVIQDQLKKLVELAKESGNDEVAIDNIEFNAAKYQNIDLHTFSVPVPADEEQAQEVFGENLNVVVGTGKQSAYLAFGDESMALLKRVIDVSAASAQKEIVPFQLNVSLAPIMAFAASLDDDATVKMLSETIKKSEGKDHVRITQKTVDRGTIVRLEIEEGVLQLIGAAAKAQNQRNN